MPKRVNYSFELADFDITSDSEVASIRCVDKRYVEIEYLDGRRVRYIYNHILSEQ